MASEAQRSDLLQGTLDMLILKVVALGPTHGYAIAQRLQQMSGSVLQVQQGSLYPALHRLEKRRWLRAEWAASDTGREARFYSLTRAGRKQLEEQRAYWDRLSQRDLRCAQHRGVSPRRHDMSWRDWFSLPLTRKQREREIAREIRAHLEFAADDRRGAGMSPEAARAAAARAFGNRTLVGEDMRAIWGTPSLDALLQDLRYAVRTIRRAPGFAAIAVGSTALGIGACSAIFAIANFAVYKPMPVAEPERLMSLSEIDRRTGEAETISPTWISAICARRVPSRASQPARTCCPPRLVPVRCRSGTGDPW